MSALPAEVTVCALLPVGTRYILPRRDVGDLPAMGVKAMWVGIAVMVVGVAVLSVAIWRVFGESWDVWLLNPLAAFGALVLLGGAFLAGIGILVAYGHAEILLDRDFITARERAGLVRWTWRQPLEMIKQLEVTTALVNPRQERSRNLYRIQAGDIFLAAGFPKQWCVALADDLLARWPSEGSDGSPNPRPMIALTIPEPLVPPPAFERSTPPERCRVVVEDAREAISFNVPPAGIWKGSKGLFGISLVWNGISIGAAIFWYVMSRRGHTGMLIFGESIIGLCAIIGVCMLLGAVNMGWRKAAIAATNDRMMIVQRGLFGTKRQEWNRADILNIVTGPSSMAVNNVPVPELQVYSADGVFGVLAGHPTEELEWMATLLRRRLGIVSPQTEDTTA